MEKAYGELACLLLRVFLRQNEQDAYAALFLSQLASRGTTTGIGVTLHFLPLGHSQTYKI